MLNGFVVAALLIGLSTDVVAQNKEKKSQPSLLEKWQSNLRTTYDFSNSVTFNAEDSFTKNIIGFDFHKIVTGKSKDIATIVFQPYLVNFSDRDRQPFFFDDRDTELTWRITNINFNLLANGALNLRLGHFELPFGLEQNIDTNGTLRQYSFFDRGIKTDWGLTANGVIASWEYELALSRGSGNDISDRDQPHIVSGRIGSASHKNRVVGFSIFSGDVLGENGTTQQQRLGIDLAWYYNQWELLAEISAGEVDDAETALGLIEASWRNPRELSHIYVQLKRQHLEIESNRDESLLLIAGINQKFSRDFSMSGQLSKPLERFVTKDSSSRFTVQLRFRL